MAISLFSGKPGMAGAGYLAHVILIIYFGQLCLFYHNFLLMHVYWISAALMGLCLSGFQQVFKSTGLMCQNMRFLRRKNAFPTIISLPIMLSKPFRLN